MWKPRSNRLKLTAPATCVRLATPRYWLSLQRLTASVPDMQDENGVILNREKDPIHVGLLAVEQMAHFTGRPCSPGPAGTASEIQRGMRWRPAGPETTGSRPLRRAAKAAIQESRPRPARLLPSFQRGRSCLRRRSARNSVAGLVRPAFTSS